MARKCGESGRRRTPELSEVCWRHSGTSVSNVEYNSILLLVTVLYKKSSVFLASTTRKVTTYGAAPVVLQSHSVNSLCGVCLRCIDLPCQLCRRARRSTQDNNQPQIHTVTCRGLPAFNSKVMAPAGVPHAQRGGYL